MQSKYCLREAPLELNNQYHPPSTNTRRTFRRATKYKIQCNKAFPIWKIAKWSWVWFVLRNFNPFTVILCWSQLHNYSLQDPCLGLKDPFWKMKCLPFIVLCKYFIFSKRSFGPRHGTLADTKNLNQSGLMKINKWLPHTLQNSRTRTTPSDAV